MKWSEVKEEVERLLGGMDMSDITIAVLTQDADRESLQVNHLQAVKVANKYGVRLLEFYTNHTCPMCSCEMEHE